MKAYTKPQKLMEAKTLIRRSGIHIRKLDYEAMEEAAYLDLMDRIIYKREVQMKTVAYTLTKQEVGMLCWYLPVVKEEKERALVQLILTYRMDYDCFVVFFLRWQQHYMKNTFLPVFEIAMRSEEIRRQFQEEYHCNLGMYVLWQQAEFLEYEISSYCIEADCMGMDSFQEAINRVGIQTNSRLEQQCCSLFYLVCGAAAYRRLGQEGILGMAKKMSFPMLKVFLSNFVLKMTAEEIRYMMELADFFHSMIGNYATPSYKEFFESLEPRVEKRYHSWMNQYLLHNGIADKKRRTFWQEYMNRCDVYSYAAVDVLILNFGKFAALEFREQKPTYFYDMEYYLKVVKNEVEGSLNENELYKRLEQIKGWQMKYESSSVWSVELKKVIRKMLQ